MDPNPTVILPETLTFEANEGSSKVVKGMKKEEAGYKT